METQQFDAFWSSVAQSSLTDKECVGVLMHETAHCAFLHCYRRKYREPKRWNIACDKAVNAVLVAANSKKPLPCAHCALAAKPVQAPEPEVTIVSPHEADAKPVSRSLAGGAATSYARELRVWLYVSRVC